MTRTENLPRSKNAPQERFCPPERAAGTSCSIPVRRPKKMDKKKTSCSLESRMFW